MAFVSNGDIKIQACRYRPCEGVAFIQSLLSFLVQTSRLVELTEPFGLAHLELESAEAGRERDGAIQGMPKQLIDYLAS